MNSKVYFLKPLLVFLFSSFIFACGAETPSNTQTPRISAHPQGADYIQGTTAELSVTARVGDGGSLTYQWYTNTANSNNGGAPIVSATSSTYRLPTGTVGTFYYYVVVISTNSAASMISNVAVINVIPEIPRISAHPQGADYIQGTTAELSVTARAGDGGSLTYQWYTNTTNGNNGGTPIVSATSSTYRLPTGTAGTFYYYVVVTNLTALAISNVAVINVIPETSHTPVISAHPQGADYIQGTTAVINITVLYIPIYNAVDLYNIRYNLSANYRLMNDISLSDYNIGSGWEPMGRCAVNADVPFSGSLDGNGYKITDLYINTIGVTAGIFGCLTGRVDNLGVEIAAGGVTTTSSSSRSSYAGGIAGYVSGGTISSSYTTGGVSSTATYSSTSSYAGGIAGYVSGGTISDSYSTGGVSSTSYYDSSYAGGIAGYFDGDTISGSHSSGDIFSTTTSSSISYAGGIAGYVSGGTISDSYSTGSISSSSSAASNSYAYAGGITGYISGTISDSYSTGGISSSSTSTTPNSYSPSPYSYSYSGGITGYASGTINGSYSTGDISSSSSSPSYSNSYSYSGGIAGYTNGSITDCAAVNGYITTSGGTQRGRIVGTASPSFATNNFANSSMLVNSATVSDNANNGRGKTIADLQTQATYENAVNGDGLGGLGWEFGNSGGAPIWKMPVSGTGYPLLYWQTD